MKSETCAGFGPCVSPGRAGSFFLHDSPSPEERNAGLGRRSVFGISRAPSSTLPGPSGAWSPCDKVQGQPLGLQSSQSMREGSRLMRKENTIHTFWTYFTGKLLFCHDGLLQVDPRKCGRTSGCREWTGRTRPCVKLLGSQVTMLSCPVNVSLRMLFPSRSVPPEVCGLRGSEIMSAILDVRLCQRFCLWKLAYLPALGHTGVDFCYNNPSPCHHLYQNLFQEKAFM